MLNLLDKKFVILDNVVKVKSRSTFKETYDSILVNSQIKRVVNGELPPSLWADAIERDIATVNAFFDNFVEDISNICAAKNRHISRGTTFALSNKWQKIPDLKERSAALWDELQIKLAVYTRQILANIKSRTVSPGNVDFCMPLSWVRKEGHIVTFEWADTPTQTVVRKLIDWSYKSPEDFTRKIPDEVTDTLMLLQETHYDYKPTILDGRLVHEEQVEMTTFPMDPGLVLRLGWEDRDLMVRYWKEPIVDDKEWDQIPPTLFGAINFVLFLVFGFAGYATFTYTSSGWFIPLGILLCIISFVFGICTASAVYDIFSSNESNTLTV